MKLSKFLITLIVLMTAFNLTSCSKGKKNKKDTSASSETALSDEADFIVDADDEELITEDDEPLELTDDPVEEKMDQEVAEVKEEVAQVADSAPVQIDGGMGTYTVKKNETLMMIAFNIYGDYRMWKDLRDLNGMRGSGLKAGMQIQYKMPSSQFVWNPDGLPYLIKTGDSLVSISSDKYGTPNKWRSIYNNNKPLIKDPNLIFAGFTLYYLPARDVASE